MTPPHQLVPAAYVVFRRDTEILLQLRRGTGFMDEHWATAAAGHIEPGESPHAAALREAEEELSVRIAVEDLVPLCGMQRTQRTGLAIDERVDFFFACWHWLGEPRRAEPDKAAELRWYPLEELPEPVVPHELHVFERLRAGTLAPVESFGFR